MTESTCVTAGYEAHSEADAAVEEAEVARAFDSIARGQPEEIFEPAAARVEHAA